MTRFGRGKGQRTLQIVRLLAVAIVALAVAAPAEALADVGYEGPSYDGTGTPTGTKRQETDLWWNDGSWWAHMWDTASKDFHIFRLDEGAQQWLDTGVTVERRPNTNADVLWDGTHLYVASNEFVSENQPAVAGSPSYLHRFSYDSLTKTYSPDPGFPATINNYKTETLTIEKDSTGKLWATWPQDNQIYVNRTVGDDQTWGTPFALTGTGSSVTPDDNAAVVAFGDRIGVMWSNQTASGFGMWFAEHVDGQPDTTWEPNRAAVQGGGSADDHVQLQADRNGRVFAAIKTSRQVATASAVELLVRDPATGAWSNHSVARVSDCATRPLLLIDEENEEVHVYATYPGPPDYACTPSGGAIHVKSSPLSAISFPEGAGTPVIEDSDSPFVTNVNSTKQNVNSTTGMAVLAVNRDTDRYWHNFLPILPSLPVADFSATPTSGSAPLAVAFEGSSSGGAATSWSWDFGDGSGSVERDPTHTYTAPGSYTVSLTATNARGSDTETKTGHITVGSAADFSLSASPASRDVFRWDSTKFDIAVTPTNGFSGPVKLSVKGLPSGVYAAFIPNKVNVPGATSSRMVVGVAWWARLGTYPLVVTGTNGTQSRSTTVSLRVRSRFQRWHR
jgi:PKD repeat protein